MGSLIVMRQGERHVRRRRNRLPLATALAIAFLALAPNAFAQSTSGSLVRSFGRNGEAIVGVSDPQWANLSFAKAGDGRVVASLGASLVELLPNGELNREFGESGELVMRDGSGAPENIVAIATDPWGRILTVGTVGEGSGASSLSLSRFFPSGEPDPSFGVGGTVETDLGLPAPNPDLQQVGGVVAEGLAVDEDGRPLITGSWRIISPGQQGCSTACHASFVARLTVDGRLDASFGTGGVMSSAGGEFATGPILTGGSLLYLSRKAPIRGCCISPTAHMVDGWGVPEPTFGSGGEKALGFIATPSVAVDRRGRILMLGSYEEDPATIFLSRLKPTGAVDPKFASGGQAQVGAGSYPHAWALGVDPEERALVAFSSPKVRLALSRRRPDGYLDQRFGHRGRVTPSLRAPLAPRAILVEKNLILVGGTTGNRAGDTPRIALAAFRASP